MYRENKMGGKYQNLSKQPRFSHNNRYKYIDLIGCYNDCTIVIWENKVGDSE